MKVQCTRQMSKGKQVTGSTISLQPQTKTLRQLSVKDKFLKKKKTRLDCTITKGVLLINMFMYFFKN